MARSCRGRAGSKGQQHLLAISGRPSLDASVTDVLVTRGDRNVVHALARNSGARFSQTGFTELVERARDDEVLSEKLGMRVDIPVNLLRQIVQRATEIVRRRLLAAAPAELRDSIRSTIDQAASESAQSACVSATSLRRIAKSRS